MNKFRSFKQHDRSSCVAVVAAMATRTTPEEFVKFVQDKEREVCEKKGYDFVEIKPPYSDVSLQRYLLEFNLIIGVGAGQVTRGKDGVLIGECSFNCSDYPAYVTVKSERLEGKEHALYWSGSQLYDPNPTSQNERDPSSYSIVGWFPIIGLRSDR